MKDIKAHNKLTKDDILAALRQINDPISGQDIVATGLVQGVTLGSDHVRIVIESPPQTAASREKLPSLCERAIKQIAPGLRVQAILTAHRKPSMPQTAAPKIAPEINAQAIIAVASGKGGVGKSTVAVNLAVALAARDKQVGLLDADIYGPSTPAMMGVDQKPLISENKKITPIEAHGVKLMSLGLLVDAARAMIWRGPMVHSAITQMLDDVVWGALDVLVIDMPPGTGDAQLTLAQRRILSGVVLVSTPQDIALADVRRALAMFKRVETPILGIVENMAWFAPDDQSPPIYIFGRGGARQLAEQENIPFLGEIPLDPALREAADRGQPDTHKKIFGDIADKISVILSK